MKHLTDILLLRDRVGMNVKRGTHCMLAGVVRFYRRQVDKVKRDRGGLASRHPCVGIYRIVSTNIQEQRTTMELTGHDPL
jgi:hypothetical protein